MPDRRVGLVKVLLNDGLKSGRLGHSAAAGPVRSRWAHGGQPRRTARRGLLQDSVVLAVACLLVAVGLPSPATAESAPETPPGEREVLSIGVSPVRHALTLDPGESTIFQATVSCGGNQRLQARAIARDALRQEPRGFRFLDPGREFWSAGSWLEISPSQFDLSPGEQTSLRVRVTVPPDTPPGEYYAAFFVEARPDDPEPPPGMSLQLSGSVGALVYVAVGRGLPLSAELTHYREVPSEARPKDPVPVKAKSSIVHWWRSLVIADRNVAVLTEGQPLRVFVPIKNTGAAHVQPRVTVSFRRGDTTLKTIIVSGEIILPDETRAVEVLWSDAPLAGSLTLALEVEYGGAEPLRATRTFLILPVRALVGFAALVFGLGYLAALRRSPGVRGRWRRGDTGPPVGGT
ncbi:MAG: hypothetical protein K6U08_02145 [Firmicutes bacterium]|nr:hypothetical protein [Bacillota bacterium]